MEDYISYRVLENACTIVYMYDGCFVAKAAVLFLAGSWSSLVGSLALILAAQAT